MSVREIKKGIFSVGAIDWDRRLFDELIPLPDGTSYNSYLIRQKEKICLVDTVDPTKEDELVKNLESLNIKHIDYVISHHAEQDHSGAIPAVLEHFPMAKVVTNAKCKSMLIDLFLIPDDKFMTIEDHQTLSLGDRTLEFIFAPWVHWPETMLTYLEEEKILFSCDFFGSHLATSDLFTTDEPKVYESAKRYYAEIMMPFRTNIQSHLKNLERYKIDMICPSHGPVYNRPNFIIDAYRDWTSDKVKNEVIIAYVSMHGSTNAMVKFLIDALMKRSIKVLPFNVTRTDIGELAIALVDAATIVIATPTVLVGPHPAAVYATYLANALRPKLRFATVVGSFGWGGKIVETITGMVSNLKVEFIPPVIIKGYPKEVDFKALEHLAEEIFKRHETL